MSDPTPLLAVAVLRLHIKGENYDLSNCKAANRSADVI